MTKEDLSGVYDNPRPLVLLVRGDEPFEGDTLVEFDSAGRPIHFFDDRKAPQRSSRIVAFFRAVEFSGQLIPRYYPVVCECERPVVNGECWSWKPKGGRSNLCRDAAVALGRLPQRGDKLTPSKLFGGKLFRAEIRVVRTDRNGKPLLQVLWYSRLGELTQIEAGGSPRMKFQTPISPISVTKTNTYTTTKVGNE